MRWLPIGHRSSTPRAVAGAMGLATCLATKHATKHAATLAATCAALALAVPALAASEIAAASTGSAESRAAIVATGVAQVTGLAISPLLVLVAIGGYDYFSAGGPDASAGGLPLHANPWLLVPCALVLALTIAKKFASPAIPLPIRKMLDAAEYLEAKLSALVAAGVLLPTILSTVAAAAGSDPAGMAAPQAAFVGGALGGWLLALPLLAVFAAVWITFHAVDALIVLSPFAIVDAALVTARAALLALIGAALLVSPWLALVVVAPVVVVAFLVAGWCVRLDLFAFVLAKDVLFRRSGDVEGARTAPRAFLAARGHGAPIRTMGHVEPADDAVRFTYRPFFVLPARTLVIPCERAELVRGMLWSNLGSAGRRPVVALPPRYNRHAELISTRFRAVVRAGLLRRSWSGIRDAFAGVVVPASSTGADG